jgi:hypothetical protein
MRTKRALKSKLFWTTIALLSNSKITRSKWTTKAVTKRKEELTDQITKIK